MIWFGFLINVWKYNIHKNITSVLWKWVFEEFLLALSRAPFRESSTNTLLRYYKDFFLKLSPSIHLEVPSVFFSEILSQSPADDFFPKLFNWTFFRYTSWNCFWGYFRKYFHIVFLRPLQKSISWNRQSISSGILQKVYSGWFFYTWKSIWLFFFLVVSFGIHPHIGSDFFYSNISFVVFINIASKVLYWNSSMRYHMWYLLHFT